MTTATEPRRLEDLEQDAIARVDAEFQRRALGVKPWTFAEYIERCCRVHARYEAFRQWQRLHPQAVA
jgi:hypothetical protein